MRNDGTNPDSLELEALQIHPREFGLKYKIRQSIHVKICVGSGDLIEILQGIFTVVFSYPSIAIGKDVSCLFRDKNILSLSCQFRCGKTKFRKLH